MPVRGGVLQRKCACGGAVGIAQDCDECSKQSLSLRRSTQNSELGTQKSVGVPPIVHEVLGSPAQPLDATTRAFMEPRFGHDFSRVQVFPATTDQAQANGRIADDEIPIVGQEDEEDEVRPALTLQPVPANEDELPGDGDLGPTPALPGGTNADKTADSCAVPLSMTKVTSGQFHGGFTLDDYYPDAVGGGRWVKNNTAGPWDTGSRAGASVQLFGTFPSPCRPELFSLTQKVTRTVYKVDGVSTPVEGTSDDDIAKSGRDASKAPFRRDWLEAGYNASMADPPNSPYSASTSKEYVKKFVTGLKGPGGEKTVDWTIELKIENGKVTRNTVS